MVAELRELKGVLALHTNTGDIEKRLKKLKAYRYSVPYYSTRDGKIVGIDLYFDRSAGPALRKLVSNSQLPLF